MRSKLKGKQKKSHPFRVAQNDCSKSDGIVGGLVPLDKDFQLEYAQGMCDQSRSMKPAQSFGLFHLLLISSSVLRYESQCVLPLSRLL